jgi:hypothetical protein
MLTELFLEKHSSEVTIVILCAMLLGTLLILVPQLLRANQQTQEMFHNQRMKALDQGHKPPSTDDRTWAAGRTAFLVPMVVVCAAGTVTCFVAAYRTENLFAVVLSIWCVAGVVSLAAITGGVALLGRLAQLNAGFEEEEPEEGMTR